MHILYFSLPTLGADTPPSKAVWKTAASGLLSNTVSSTFWGTFSKQHLTINGGRQEPYSTQFTETVLQEQCTIFPFIALGSLQFATFLKILSHGSSPECSKTGKSFVFHFEFSVFEKTVKHFEPPSRLPLTKQVGGGHNRQTKNKPVSKNNISLAALAFQKFKNKM